MKTEHAITYEKQLYNNRGVIKETFIPRVFKDKNKSFWLNRVLQLISNARDDRNTKRKVRFKMGSTTYELVNTKELMVGFYKRLSSRKNNVFPDAPDISTSVTRSAPLRKTKKSKTCYVCRKLKPNRMFYQRKNGTYFSGCIPCQKTIRANSKERRGY